MRFRLRIASGIQRPDRPGIAPEFPVHPSGSYPANHLERPLSYRIDRCGQSTGRSKRRMHREIYICAGDAAPATGV